MLIEQLAHERGPAPRGGQNEDVCSLVGVVGGEGDGGRGGGVREAVLTAVVRGLGSLLAHTCQTPQAAVEAVGSGRQAHGAQQVERFGREGADGCVLDGDGGQRQQHHGLPGALHGGWTDASGSHWDVCQTRHQRQKNTNGTYIIDIICFPVLLLFSGDRE